MLTYREKEDIEDVIKVKYIEMKNNPCRPSLNTWVPKSREPFPVVRTQERDLTMQEHRYSFDFAVIEDRASDSWAKKCRCSLEERSSSDKRDLG